jgi:Zn finger protein HypA/HybF involved in hydrogenase expression
MVTETYPLLKNGTHHAYYRCECCTHFVRKLSNRGWCSSCESEFTIVGRRVREKLRDMGIPDPPELVDVRS